MNPILQDILARQVVLDLNGQEKPLRANIPSLEGQILQAWVAQAQPARLLEIGLGHAVSTLFICDALQASGQATVYHIVDPFQKEAFEDIGVFNLDRAGYGDLYALHRIPSEMILPKFWIDGETFDFIYIDGDHSFDHAFVDYFYGTRMLTPGGIIVFDDIQLDSIQAVTQHLEDDPAYERLDIPPELAQNQTLRVRRISGHPESRVVGYRKLVAGSEGG